MTSDVRYVLRRVATWAVIAAVVAVLGYLGLEP